MIYHETPEIMDAVKLLLGIDSCDKDAVIALLTEDTIAAVLAHCRIDALPYQLHGLIAQMAAKAYRVNGYGTEETPADVKSVSEGDRSISFEVRSGTNGIISDYRSRLKPFVNRKGRVPSEVE